MLDCGLLLVLHADFWLVCLLSWVGSLLSAGQLRVRGRNWFRVIIMTTKKKQVRIFCSFHSFMTLRWAAKCSQFHMQMNDGKLVMHPETDIGSELCLVSPNLAWHLSKLINILIHVYYIYHYHYICVYPLIHCLILRVFYFMHFSGCCPKQSHCGVCALLLLQCNNQQWRKRCGE